MGARSAFGLRARGALVPSSSGPAPPRSRARLQHPALDRVHPIAARGCAGPVCCEGTVAQHGNAGAGVRGRPPRRKWVPDRRAKILPPLPGILEARGRLRQVCTRLSPPLSGSWRRGGLAPPSVKDARFSLLVLLHSPQTPQPQHRPEVTDPGHSQTAPTSRQPV
jgi:hypothetical protein